MSTRAYSQLPQHSVEVASHKWNIEHEMKDSTELRDLDIFCFGCKACEQKKAVFISLGITSQQAEIRRMPKKAIVASGKFSLTDRLVYHVGGDLSG